MLVKVVMKAMVIVAVDPSFGIERGTRTATTGDNETKHRKSLFNIVTRHWFL